MIVAIIPARGGSKRIPRKNIRPFFNKPIIAWSIEAAQEYGGFDKIIVSTDDQEIADMAVSYGAEVPFKRPARISDDFTGTNAVVKHAIEWLNSHGSEINYACCIYPTAPFIRVEDIKTGFELLSASEKSYAFSVTSFSFPIQRAIQINQSGEIEPIWPENINARSQDLVDAYHDAGQFYWGNADAFLKEVTLYSNASLPVVLPRYHVQDIDTEEDWNRAELMFKLLNYK